MKTYFKIHSGEKSNKCNQCDLYRLVREEICGDISKTHTVENKKYEYAKSYSNHDGIVEILSVEINSENREIMEFGQEF